VIGVAGLAAVSSVANSRSFCKLVGVILLLLGLLGIFVPNLLGLIPLGGGDIAIHLLSGAVLAYFGFVAPVSLRTT
jgi:hypothetical protein